MEHTAQKNKGFTLIELVLVISLLGIILSITTVNLFKPVSKANIETVSVGMISLLSEAQNKSMNSATDGDPISNTYGLHFENNSYTLFKGSSFVPGDNSNFEVSTPSGVFVTPSLSCSSPPGDCNNLIFQKISGGVVGFDPVNNSVCITHTSTNKQLKLIINSLGVVNTTNVC